MTTGTLQQQRAQDAAARRLAQLEFRRPLLLEAGAGTGKTTTLVGRVLAWSLGPGWKAAEAELRATAAGRAGAGPTPTRVASAVLDGIVAITFTDAAAGELEQRIGLDVAQLAGGQLPTGLLEEALPPSPEIRALRARALCDTLDRLRVSTIHGFCWRLISRHPLDLGLAPRLAVDSEQTIVPAVAQEVVEDWLRAVAGRPLQPHEASLAANGVGPEELQGALVALATQGVPAAALAGDPLAPAHVRALAGRLRGAAAAVQALIAPALAGGGKGLAFSLPAVLGALVDDLEGAGESLDALRAAVAGACPDLESGYGDVLDRWARAKFTQSEAARLSGLAELPARAGRLRRTLAHIAALQPALLDAARRTLQPMLDQVHQRLRAAAVETYQSLLLRARELLRDHPEARAQERAGIRQLLVDEFQDTDTVQCEIVQLLALDGDPARRPGLFLVGDPKQSIYGWRSADLRAYDGFCDLLRANGGAIAHLVVNFRSAPAILDEVDRVIQPVMRAQHGVQPNYRELQPSDRTARELAGTTLAGTAPAHPATAAQQARIAYWVTPSALNASDAVQAEASAFAHDLLARKRHAEQAGATESFQFGGCALLLRSTTDLDDYLHALRTADIPFAVERDRSYYRRREIIDAAALIAAVLDPADLLALVALLRSPMVGVPDAALLPLWAGGLPDRVANLREVDAAALEQLRELLQRVARELPPGIPGLERIRGWENSATAALHALALLRASFAADPPDVFLERVRQTFQQEVVEASRFLGQFRVANLDRFHRALAAAMDQSGSDPQVILRLLRASVARETQAEEARPPAGTMGSVRVMTVHKAKGLEFDHVYLGQIHKQGRQWESRPTRAVELDGSHEFQLLGAASPGYDRVGERRLEVEAAERVRTLYVAMTRARKRLVLLGRWPEQLAPERAQRAATYIDLLQARRVAPPLSELAEAAAPAGMVDAAGVAWCATEPSDPPEARHRPLALLPTAALVDAVSLRLHRERAAAAARMARPRSEALSHAAHEALVLLLREGALPQPLGARDDSEGGAASDVPAAALRRAVDLVDSVQGGAQRVAVAVGTLVHRVLEEADLTNDLGAALERQQALLPRLAAGLLGDDPAVCAAVVAQAAALLQQLPSSRLGRRLRELAPNVLARELPLLAPPGTALPPGSVAASAVGFRSGLIDLLYRDPQTGELVVADYKTDAVVAPEALRQRAAAYRPQVAAYAGALAEALGAATLPRAELWFLAADAIVRVDAGATEPS